MSSTVRCSMYWVRRVPAMPSSCQEGSRTSVGTPDHGTASGGVLCRGMGLGPVDSFGSGLPVTCRTCGRGLPDRSDRPAVVAPGAHPWVRFSRPTSGVGPSSGGGCCVLPGQDGLPVAVSAGRVRAMEHDLEGVHQVAATWGLAAGRGCPSSGPAGVSWPGSGAVDAEDRLPGHQGRSRWSVVP